MNTDTNCNNMNSAHSFVHHKANVTVGEKIKDQERLRERERGTYTIMEISFTNVHRFVG